MQFLITAYDGKDDEAQARRAAARPAHIDGAKSLKDAGNILIGGNNMAGKGPNERPTALIFQNLALFRTMSGLDNIMVGAHCQSSSDFLSNAFRLPWVRREEKQSEDQAWELI